MAPHCPSIAGIIALLANLMRLVSDPVIFGPVFEARNVPTSTDTSSVNNYYWPRRDYVNYALQ
jgi:hypothetical protein